jgi:hypothetical protein
LKSANGTAEQEITALGSSGISFHLSSHSERYRLELSQALRKQMRSERLQQISPCSLPETA